jgi:nucleoside-diphosphate-sugar epimerase
VICGFSVGNPLNLIAVLGVYATISRELDLPLRFPGKPGAYDVVCQATDLELLVRALVWMSTSPNCANQAFNITNGDFFRYRNLWPLLGDYFGMPIAPPQTIDLPAFMADKGALWDRIVEKYRLVPNRFEQVADWNFANYTFSVDWDVMSSMHKAHSLGFHDFVDTEAMFLRQLERFRTERVIP